jgi:hypothetical protein
MTGYRDFGDIHTDGLRPNATMVMAMNAAENLPTEDAVNSAGMEDMENPDAMGDTTGNHAAVAGARIIAKAEEPDKLYLRIKKRLTTVSRFLNPLNNIVAYMLTKIKTLYYYHESIKPERKVMKKLLYPIALFLIAGLSYTAGYSQDEVHIRVAPPRPRHEVIIERPAAGMVWQKGYHEYDPVAKTYIWHEGKWETPPREHAVWVAPYYRHAHGEYIFIAGHWK